MAKWIVIVALLTGVAACSGTYPGNPTLTGPVTGY